MRHEFHPLKQGGERFQNGPNLRVALAELKGLGRQGTGHGKVPVDGGGLGLEALGLELEPLGRVQHLEITEEHEQVGDGSQEDHSQQDVREHGILAHRRDPTGVGLTLQA
ncbi:MAG: hypothetical protein M5U12_17325 [Verrucomicrobia bacterium]|nr:hypothetical protein [Verrucomicrobiota bacterium]